MRAPVVLTLPQARAVAAALDAARGSMVSAMTADADPETVEALGAIYAGILRHQRDLEGLLREVRG